MPYDYRNQSEKACDTAAEALANELPDLNPEKLARIVEIFADLVKGILDQHTSDFYHNRAPY